MSSGPPSDPTGRFKIVYDAKKIIHKKRKDESLGVYRALKSTMHLKAQIIGINVDEMPFRELEVPGNIPLAAFYDRVLCPVFGWTRGYHEFVFIVHPMGYMSKPPMNPCNDFVFGAELKTARILGNHGLFGPIRDTKQLRVDDSTVCLADLMHEPGHDIDLVLAGSAGRRESLCTG